MKKTGILILGLMIVSYASIAQQQMKQMSARERADMQTRWMKTSLSPDSAQMVKIADLNLKYALKMDPVISGNQSKLSKLKTFKAYSEQKEGELKKILTKNQFEIYEQQKEEMKDRMREYKK